MDDMNRQTPKFRFVAHAGNGGVATLGGVAAAVVIGRFELI